MGKDKATTSTVTPIADPQTQALNSMYAGNLTNMFAASPGGQGLAGYVAPNNRLAMPTQAELATLQNIYNRQSAPLINPIEDAAMTMGLQGMDRYSGLQDAAGGLMMQEYGRAQQSSDATREWMLGQQAQNQALQGGILRSLEGFNQQATGRIDSLTAQALAAAAAGQGNANAAYGAARGDVSGYYGSGQAGVGAANAQGRGDVMGLMAPTQAQIDQYYSQALSGMLGTMGQGTGAVSGVGGQAAGRVGQYYGQGGADIGAAIGQGRGDVGGVAGASRGDLERYYGLGNAGTQGAYTGGQQGVSGYFGDTTGRISALGADQEALMTTSHPFAEEAARYFGMATDPTGQVNAAKARLEDVVAPELANRLTAGGFGGVRGGGYGEALARGGSDLVLPIMDRVAQNQATAGQSYLGANTQRLNIGMSGLNALIGAHAGLGQQGMASETALANQLMAQRQAAANAAMQGTVGLGTAEMGNLASLAQAEAAARGQLAQQGMSTSGQLGAAEMGALSSLYQQGMQGQTALGQTGMQTSSALGQQGMQSLGALASAAMQSQASMANAGMGASASLGGNMIDAAVRNAQTGVQAAGQGLTAANQLFGNQVQGALGFGGLANQSYGMGLNAAGNWNQNATNLFGTGAQATNAFLGQAGAESGRANDLARLGLQYGNQLDERESQRYMMGLQAAAAPRQMEQQEWLRGGAVLAPFMQNIPYTPMGGTQQTNVQEGDVWNDVMTLAALAAKAYAT